MNRDRIDSWCERGILALVLFILAFGPLAAGAVRTLEFLIVQALTLAVLVLWVVRMWFGRQPRLLWPPLCWPVLAFALYAVARYLTSDIEYLARWELLRVLVYTALFFAVLNNLHRQENIRLITLTTIGVALLLTCCAVWQFLSRTDKVPSLGTWMESVFFGHKNWYFDRIYVTRASGTYVNPNHLAGFLEMLLPLALACTLIGRHKTLTRVYLGYAALAMVAGIGVSVSRGSWIATAFAVLLFFAILAIHNTYRVPSLVMMFLIIMSCSFFITRTEYFQERFRKTFAKGRLELDVRYQLWESTVQMWRDHFWFGVGPGHYDYRFRAYRPEEVQLRPDRAHNEFLNLLSDWGVVGTAIVAAALLCATYSVFRTWKHVRKPESDFSRNLSSRFSFFLGTFLGLVAVFIHASVDFNMQIPANAILVFCLAALLSSQVRHATDKVWIQAGWPVRTLTTAAAVAIVGFGGFHGTRLAREYVWLARAEAGASKSETQIAAWKSAFAIEPRNPDNCFAIADAYQTASKQGGENYREMATNAITWFEHAIELNPFNGYSYSGIGWCWDWIALRNEDPALEAALHEKAEHYFIRAEELDPKGYFMIKDVALHFVQTGNYSAARVLCERSLRLKRRDNDTAAYYYDRASRELAERQTNQFGILNQ